MAVQDLNSDVRGFLYNFFNQASTIFKRKSEELAGPEAQTASDLSLAFSRARFMARRDGDAQSMTVAIEELKAKVDGLTDPGLKDAAAELRDWQKIYFRHVKPQEKVALGSYSNGIF